MNASLERERLARKSARAELWAALEAEERQAEEARRKFNWRKVLRTKAMRDDAAQSNT